MKFITPLCILLNNLQFSVLLLHVFAVVFHSGNSVFFIASAPTEPATTSSLESGFEVSAEVNNSHLFPSTINESEEDDNLAVSSSSVSSPAPSSDNESQADIDLIPELEPSDNDGEDNESHNVYNYTFDFPQLPDMNETKIIIKLDASYDCFSNVLRHNEDLEAEEKADLQDRNITPIKKRRKLSHSEQQVMDAVHTHNSKDLFDLFSKCPICFEAFDVSNMVRQLDLLALLPFQFKSTLSPSPVIIKAITECNHIFHPACLAEIPLDRIPLSSAQRPLFQNAPYRISRNCPLCRQMTGPLSTALVRESIVREALRVAQDTCGEDWIGKKASEGDLKALLHISDGALAGSVNADTSRAARFFKVGFAMLLIAGIWTFTVVVGDLVNNLSTERRWTSGGFQIAMF